MFVGHDLGEEQTLWTSYIDEEKAVVLSIPAGVYFGIKAMAWVSGKVLERPSLLWKNRNEHSFFMGYSVDPPPS